MFGDLDLSCLAIQLYLPKMYPCLILWRKQHVPCQDGNYLSWRQENYSAENLHTSFQFLNKTGQGFVQIFLTNVFR